MRYVSLHSGVVGTEILGGGSLKSSGSGYIHASLLSTLVEDTHLLSCCGTSSHVSELLVVLNRISHALKVNPDLHR